MEENGAIKVNRAKRREVARLANVSEATVSFVFSKKRFVSQKLTERVLRVAEELDYQPDKIAQSMMTKSSQTIAILTNDIASPLQMEVIKGLQNEAQNDGFFVNVCGGISHLESYVDNFISRRIDGVFISVLTNLFEEKYLKKLLDYGISVIVTSSRGMNDPRLCGIELDFWNGMKQILDHLVALGHTKIAYVSCFDDSYTDRRLQAFRHYMKELLWQDDPLICMGGPPFDSTVQVGYELTQQLLQRNCAFTAVVCTNDLMAFGAMQALNESGRRIPDDVSLVGIDDICLAACCMPSLTTLSHHAEAYGQRIYDILRDNIRDKSCVRREIVKPKLIVRDSTAPAGNGAQNGK